MEVKLGKTVEGSGDAILFISLIKISLHVNYYYDCNLANNTLIPGTWCQKLRL